jgi:hypothetical protein
MGYLALSATDLSYMTVAVTVHALLLSLGGLMAVNAVRSLAQAQQAIWDTFEEKQVGIREVGRAKSEVFTLMKINLLIDSLGILLAMLTIVYSPQSLVGGYSVGVSLIAVLVQLLVFSLLAIWSMRAIGIFVKKPRND